MPFINLCDANLSPIVVNTKHILFVGPGQDAQHRAIVLDAMTGAGPFSILVSNTVEQIVDRWRDAEEPRLTPFEFVGPANGQ